MAESWAQIGGKWYYLTPGSGRMATGWVKVNDNWYSLSSSGAMRTGWYLDMNAGGIGGGWYYLDGSGKMVTGYMKIGGKYHAFDPSGLWTGEAGDGVPAKEDRSHADNIVEGTKMGNISAEVFALVNKERAAAGSAPLKWDSDLATAADLRAAELTKLFEHTRPSGKSCFTADSKIMAENIAAYYTSASGVMGGWMRSAGHKANILNKTYTTIGVGCFQYNGSLYFVQVFGTNSGGAAQAPKPGNRTVVYELEL
jgi:hypothetical protein